ncbi:heme ABC transporter substrate-binding protein IsdE [Paenibacillus marchantiophytorum]|uniref:High-affinity heme uptake system protein IsdE n=1 Tax=Paenibacillus marchantiophytorum TaxID=1619310 RepID=A0ABQ1EKL9_9BACL|nr:heme ABC transporter substrate-binding protein IsdE [Paenibacillus marchantiophytorum]GFZ75917.1 heme ABC transporter substrate-binding protein IsdE [Paenibacillus marchantiophytorum]
MRMIRWFNVSVVAIAILASGCSGNDAARNLTTDTGSGGTATQTSVPMESKSPRIVSTTVAVTQFMDALDLDLVGVPTSVKTLPKRYDGVTKVGNPMTPNMEIVKSLEPTDVLSVTTLEYDLAPVFKNANLTARFLDFTSLEHMNKAILDIGSRFGKEKQAAALVNGNNAKVEQIQKQIAGKKQPKVLILLGVPGSYLVATENSYIGDLVRLAGGKNIVEGEKVEYLASNTEYLQKSNPDVILRAAHGMPEEVVKMFEKEFKKNDIWKHFSAVQSDRVYDLPEDLFPTTGNLAVGEALDATVKMLFP